MIAARVNTRIYERYMLVYLGYKVIYSKSARIRLHYLFFKLVCGGEHYYLRYIFFSSYR